MQVAASMSVGRLAPKHTLNIDGIREISKNVDPKLIKDDVILVDELKGMTIEEYTDKRFQGAIDAYNKKQKRKDRKINTGYCEWHRSNGTLSQGKGELAYEAVLQYGAHEDLGGEYYSDSTTPERKAELREEFNRVYRQWTEDLQKDFPHMHIVYAAVHFSEKEGTPHLHICFQPQADCTRGLSQQVSIGRALAQDGIERLETRAEAEQAGGFQLARFYQKFHREYQNRTLEQLGYEIKQEKHGIKHMEKDGYSVVMAAAHEQANELIQNAEQRKQRVQAETDRIKMQTLDAVFKAQEATKTAKEEKAKAEQQKAAIEAQAEKAEQRRQNVQAEADRLRIKMSSTVYEAQEAAKAAKDEKIKAEQQKAVIEAQTASLRQNAESEAKQMIENATETAQKALQAAQRAKAEQAQAERKKAAVEAQADAIRQQAKAEAEVKCVELERQLNNAKAVIVEKENIIQKMKHKLNKIGEYLTEFRAIEHFLGWIQRHQGPQYDEELTQSEEEEISWSGE